MAETGNEDTRNLETTRSDDGKSCEVVGPLSGAEEMINAPNPSHAIVSYWCLSNFNYAKIKRSGVNPFSARETQSV